MAALISRLWSRAQKQCKITTVLPVTEDTGRQPAMKGPNEQDSLTRTPSDSDTSLKSPASDVSTEVARTDSQRTSRHRPLWARIVIWILPFLKDPEDVADGRFDKSTYESVDAYQIGYPQWAARQNADPAFRTYRRFGTLRNRVILHRQQELALLEEKLSELDEHDDSNLTFKTRSLVIDKADPNSKRERLIGQIDDKLKQYDDLLDRERRSGLFKKSSRREYRSLVNYIYNKKPVVEPEIQFLKVRDDFVQLNDCTESPLENIIDYIICNWIPIRRLRRQFSSEEQIKKTNDKFTTLPSPRKVFVLARLVVIVWATVLIGVPLSVLASKTFTDCTKLIVLIVSLFAFPAAIQVAARPRTLELFVATATYCAVLSTLLGTSPGFNLSELQEMLVSSFKKAAPA